MNETEIRLPSRLIFDKNSYFYRCQCQTYTAGQANQDSRNPTSYKLMLAY